MKRLIIITGDLASGKSTLADSLSTYLKIPAFKKDGIKERYCDMYGFTTREENLKLSAMAVDYMINAFINFGKQGQELILEANFHEQEMVKIKELSEEYGYDVFVLVLRGDIETLYKRFLDRMPTRHRAHTSMGLHENIEKYKAYIYKSREEKIPFLPHIIDTTNKNQQEVLECAIKLLG